MLCGVCSGVVLLWVYRHVNGYGGGGEYGVWVLVLGGGNWGSALGVATELLRGVDVILGKGIGGGRSGLELSRIGGQWSLEGKAFGPY